MTPRYNTYWQQRIGNYCHADIQPRHVEAYMRLNTARSTNCPPLNSAALSSKPSSASWLTTIWRNVSPSLTGFECHAHTLNRLPQHS